MAAFPKHPRITGRTWAGSRARNEADCNPINHGAQSLGQTPAE